MKKLSIFLSFCVPILSILSIPLLWLQPPPSCQPEPFFLIFNGLWTNTLSLSVVLRLSAGLGPICIYHTVLVLNQDAYLDFAALNQILSHGLDQGFKEIPGILWKRWKIISKKKKNLPAIVTICCRHESSVVTLSSLLLVRKSVEGLRMAVMALASSSCTVLLLLPVYGSVLKTNWRGESCVWEDPLGWI